MKRHESAFPLFSLPWLPLMTVMKSLDSEDRKAFAGACRSLAAVVSAASQNTKLTLTSNTGWEGLQQIIAPKTITVNALELVGQVATEDQPEDSTLYDFLRSNSESFLRVQQLVLNAFPLPCLLPPNLAKLLPDLKELTVHFYLAQFANLQPLPYCNSLTAISFHGLSVKDRLFPSTYHTVGDLKRQLPNITSLYARHQQLCDGFSPSIDTMITAWGDQLTSLHVDVQLTPRQLQGCTRLQSLVLYWRDISLASLPTSLTRLELQCGITETGLGSVLQLPLLHTFACERFRNRLQRDWSKHPCTWQHISFDQLHMIDAAKLPLQPLKGKGCLNVKCLVLPDPLSQNSLHQIERVAQTVSQAGVTIQGVEQWNYDVRHQGVEADQASAELFLAASKAIQPPRSWTCQWALGPAATHWLNNDTVSFNCHTLAAILNWSSNTLSSIQFKPSYTGVPNWLWRALHCCSCLRQVKLSYYHPLEQCICEVLNQVILASENVVAVTGRPLMLEVNCQCIPECDGQEAALQLQKRLFEELPSSVSLEEFVWKSTTLSISLQPASMM